jgi:aspartate carbamoyltransferase catalytic subunit
LLDLFTLRDEFGSLEGRTIAIVGDVAHSRVAHSTVLGLARLGARTLLVGPECFLSTEDAIADATIVRDLDSALEQSDAVILLRIQRERFAKMPIDDREYVERYQLNGRRLARLHPQAIVMHPGPYNRGMELDDTVLEFAGWRYARQVHHGVYIRMAVLDLLVNGTRARVR